MLELDTKLKQLPAHKLVMLPEELEAGGPSGGLQAPEGGQDGCG